MKLFINICEKQCEIQIQRPKVLFPNYGRNEKKSFWFRFSLKSLISKGVHWEIHNFQNVFCNVYIIFSGNMLF